MSRKPGRTSAVWMASPGKGQWRRQNALGGGGRAWLEGTEGARAEGRKQGLAGVIEEQNGGKDRPWLYL